MERVTVKTSTIFVGVGDETKVYRSVADVPPTLRQKLQEATTGVNAATILIADQNGREEIVRAIRGLPSSLKNRTPAPPGPAERVRALVPRNWNAWLEIVLPGVVGLLIWLAFTSR
jgi:hypothetical protein